MTIVRIQDTELLLCSFGTGPAVPVHLQNLLQGHCLQHPLPPVDVLKRSPSLEIEAEHVCIKLLFEVYAH